MNLNSDGYFPLFDANHGIQNVRIRYNKRKQRESQSMFDFKALASVQKKVDHRDNDRQRKSDDACLEAVNILMSIKGNPLHARRSMEQAAQKLLEALEHSRSNAWAYLGLASIFYVNNDMALASKYLFLAESLQPGLPEIQQLRHILNRENKKK